MRISFTTCFEILWKRAVSRHIILCLILSGYHRVLQSVYLCPIPNRCQPLIGLPPSLFLVQPANTHRRFGQPKISIFSFCAKFCCVQPASQRQTLKFFSPFSMAITETLIVSSRGILIRKSPLWQNNSARFFSTSMYYGKQGAKVNGQLRSHNLLNMCITTRV